MSDLAAAHREFVVAARWHGAVRRLVRDNDYGLWIHWKEGHERAARLAHAALKVEAFDAAAADGEALEWQQAVVEALTFTPGQAEEVEELQPLPPPFGLSEREEEVLLLVRQGLSDKAIADRLFISPRTVKSHLRSIFGKTETGRRMEAAFRVFGDPKSRLDD